jgi:hypothetical protein
MCQSVSIICLNYLHMHDNKYRSESQTEVKQGCIKLTNISKVFKLFTRKENAAIMRMGSGIL